MSSAAYSPTSIYEKFDISKDNASISFELGSNVSIHLSAEEENSRGRDAANIQTKVIMDHKGDMRYLRGRILTANESIVSFRSINENVGESLNLINLDTKHRHRFKDLQDIAHRTVDIAFAHHQKFLAILDSESSLFVYKVSDYCDPKKFLTVTNFPSRSTRDEAEQPKISWCPYMPGDEDDEDDACHMLAIYSGRHMHILNIGMLKEAGPEEFDYEAAKNIEGAFYSVSLDEEPENADLRICAVSISPDSTAVAAAKTNGTINFYVINEEENYVKFAHTFTPTGFGRQTPITDLIFLDDLTSERKDVPFWRSCVVISNSGRRMAMYECQNWRCLGMVRFESTLTINDFIPISDPCGSFIHLLDIDGMNVYSVEVMNPSESDEYARFVGVTQTSFCHPIYALTPLTKSSFENREETDDLFDNDGDNESDDDDDDDDKDSKGKRKRVKTKRHFIAMGKKSMLELQITLKQHIASPVGTTIESSEGKDQCETLRQSGFQAIPQAVSAAGLLIPAHHIDQSGGEIMNKLDLILERLGKIESEQRDQAIRVAEISTNFESQLRLHEGYFLNRVEQVCENSRLDILEGFKSGITKMAHTMENVIRGANVESSEYVAQNVGSIVRSGLQDCVIPSFERSCGDLFEKLNDHFRTGIQEYISATNQVLQNTALATVQIAAQQQQQQIQKAEHDKQSFIQLIELSPATALENALNTADNSIVEFVISKVNPESILSPAKIGQPVLLSLLQQITVTLNSERDLKFRWLEMIIPEVDLNHPSTGKVAPDVGHQLINALKDIMDKTTDDNARRYIRLLSQTTRQSLCPNTPHPRSSTSMLAQYGLLELQTPTQSSSQK